MALDGEEGAAARLNMVRNQVMPVGVVSPSVLEAFAVVPRHLFVPKSSGHLAYSDAHIKLTPTRLMLPPHILARLIEVAIPLDNKVVLDAQGGTGYVAALLNSMCKTVIMLEEDKGLYAEAQHNLRVLKSTNVRPYNHHNDVYACKVDVVFCIGSISTVPDARMVSCLKEGGLLIYIETVSDTLSKAVLAIKVSGQLSMRNMFEIPYCK